MQLQKAVVATAPTLLSRPWRLPYLKPCTLFIRAFSTHSDQSRGGLPRFFSESLPSFKGGVVRLQGDEVWHMTKVLRLDLNDRVELFNGKGSLVEGSIKNVDRTGIDFVAARDPVSVHPQEPQWDVFAAFGTLKGGRADWLIEKCTELGASSITPLLTKRSPSISENRVERLQRVIVAATKQCQRLHEMTLNPPMEVKSILPIVGQSKLSFVAAAQSAPLLNTLTSSTIESRGFLIVGPEGDFTEEELRMIKEAGVTAVGLGPLRLRVETATITLLATLMLWSDSQQQPSGQSFCKSSASKPQYFVVYSNSVYIWISLPKPIKEGPILEVVALNLSTTWMQDNY